jgi:hypothetical protein
MEINPGPVLPRSLPGIEGKKLFDAKAFAMRSNPLFMPGHRVRCKPLRRSFAIVT